MPKRAYIDVAALLRERVEDGQYPPGSRLPAERQLAEELGVSRPTVREALAAMELMGVVDTHAGAGTFVREKGVEADGAGAAIRAPDASPSEILQVRLLIEPGTTRLATVNWDRQSLAAIARPLHALERAAEARSAAHPTKEDRQFHAAIAQASGNDVLTSILSPLWETMSQSLWRSLKEKGWSAANTEAVAREHREIYEAIRGRDPDLAGFTMEKHIRGVIESLFA
ncbi:MAG: FadR family transcriptional regulator [Actinobacteria bacterium]|nr:FadR family transcriptional regulator [Actinomycetota bacterium]